MQLILGLTWDWIILLILLAGYLGYTVYRYIKTRKILTTLTESEFRDGYRKAQLIDVREQKEYDAGHIWGARNIPVTQLKQRKQELRKDMPIYLYCQTGSRAARAAWTLHKQGHEELYQLKDGFKKWTGKIKKTKKSSY
ncbi:Rhodanese-related sulfurtransferase [Pelagirhabdus alkalitolerans]|uniref:Rhodanese-related sulfurtransferase n=1 Tax=Pelagirhabdus alkalitolerans TaxID=1612202 RepID=A0A1G6HZN9_9BACI|nr:rhodanese-like domain-containing protein [Pelagirhabdus alkalitolerans]SDB99613.1 Rhodanese-related sulfurtransferase [Pelagirhabdus alkalitolerans]